ncbi:DUF2155 domain-containing protein [Sphingobium sp. AP49]|nr:DUF2155 domain-containing protein [Sphingobium sp. AP49]WHO41105.1 DUF2155 domain-containing protein [Sphingobium sp. AP49]
MIRRPAGGFPPILIGAPLLCCVLLAGCGRNDAPEANQSGPVKIEGQPIRDGSATGLPGTPMAKRTAVIGLLNKRNGLTRDLTMKPGEALRVGDAIVRLQACETTAPWENVQETGAFIQLDVRSSADGKWRRNFSGWLFRERPERNVVQHPIYDVWVKSCTMEWPETGPDTVKLGDKGEAAVRAAPESGANANSAATPEPAANTPSPAPNGTPSTATPSN